ncbi:MAG: hypothetical protein M1829_005185 [Trizodia sp. TS-e1964]|nr:MAG: hypothetical protein M1829_005185 [Trizodia sp. TS-e1964]
MDETMQLVRKIEPYLFVELEHKTTRITHSDLVEAFPQQGQLKESNITANVIENEPVQLRYLPDLDYTHQGESNAASASLAAYPLPPEGQPARTALGNRGHHYAGEDMGASDLRVGGNFAGFEEADQA